MAIPDFQTLMLPVLKVASQGEIRFIDAVEKLQDEFKLTDEERMQLLSSGKQAIFTNRVAWAKTYLKQAGLLNISRRGYFEITEAGHSVLRDPPKKIDIKFLAKFESFNKFRSSGNNDNDSEASNPVIPSKAISLLTPDEQIRNACIQIEDELGSELLSRIRSEKPAFFERLVVKLLITMGYGDSIQSGNVTGKPNDGGIDGIIDLDKLGLDKIYIQAKRYDKNNNISASAVRDFFGAMDRARASKGLFVTTSAFSDEAIQTAEILTKRIVLVDGKQLVRLMMKYNVGCQIKETIEIKKIDEGFFEPE